MTIASFAPTASFTLSASTTSANAALPTTGTPAAALVTNLGQTISCLSRLAPLGLSRRLPACPCCQAPRSR